MHLPLWSHSVIRVTLAVLVLLALFMVALYCFQRHLLYLPHRYPLNLLLDQAPKAGLQLWPADNNYRGLLAEPSGPVKGTAIVTHGNAGSALNRTYYLQPLLKHGYRVILLEYPGYGARDGKPSEAAIVADVRESLHLATNQFTGPILLIGESLGSGVAAATLAAESDLVAGAILFTPWNDLPGLAQSIYWFLPVKGLVRDKYDSAKNLQQVSRPIAIVIAERDEIIPTKFSRQLYDSLPGPKKVWVVPHATHNDLSMYLDDDWWIPVLTFIGQTRRTP